MKAISQALRPFVSTAVFLLGCVIALGFSWAHLAPVAETYTRIPALSSDGQPLEFSCRDNDCVTCIAGLLNTPRAIVFTGGSTWRYAVDFVVLAAAMPRPVVNCIRNDSRIDAYQMFFAYARVNQPAQVVFHGYNSWAVNSPGTWVGDRTGYMFAIEAGSEAVSPWVPAWAVPAAERLLRATRRPRVALTYAHAFFSSAVTESPYLWRMYLRARHPFYAANDLSYWPLSRERHWQRRLDLMKRSYHLSAYVQSFMMQSETLQPSAEIAARHERFLAALAPTNRFVFFPGPELTQVFPDRVKDVMQQSQGVMLKTLAGHPNVRHVAIDYAACGLSPLDFWHPAQMLFDIAHVNNDATAKLTPCVVDALKRAHLDDLLAAP